MGDTRATPRQRKPITPKADRASDSGGGIGGAAVPASDPGGPIPSSPLSSSPLRPVGAERPGEVGKSAGTSRRHPVAATA